MAAMATLALKDLYMRFWDSTTDLYNIKNKTYLTVKYAVHLTYKKITQFLYLKATRIYPQISKLYHTKSNYLNKVTNTIHETSIQDNSKCMVGKLYNPKLSMYMRAYGTTALTKLSYL